MEHNVDLFVIDN